MEPIIHTNNSFYGFNRHISHDEIFTEKDNKTIWYGWPESNARANTANIIDRSIELGQTVDEMLTLSLTEISKKIISRDNINTIVTFTNHRGRITQRILKEVNQEEIYCSFTAAGFYKSGHENTKALWDENHGRPSFRAGVGNYFP